MRFIDTDTLQFVEVENPHHYKYAILSHRWFSDEVSYQDILAGTKRDSAGYKKIVDCCEQAKKQGLRRVWVDTCCIDKKSSAELSEAINSMYNWYYWSKVCYVYLVDVPPLTEASIETRLQAFRDSQWWTRGWTLQELLAPGRVEFYDSLWGKIGTKGDLSDHISHVTRIDPDYLNRQRLVEDASIAARMSWASERLTTRPEDTAYCLLGLFDVNMPLLYGEGLEKAFVRLQLEIIKKSKDESIFAWHQEHDAAKEGILAPRPRKFRYTGNIVSITKPIALHGEVFEQKPFSMTNRGLKIRFPVARNDETSRLVLLHCCFTGLNVEGRALSFGTGGADKPRWLAVKLDQVSSNQWTRARTPLIEVDPEEFEVGAKAMYVVQDHR